MALSLGRELLNTGILQFGRFVQFNKIVPIRFCPEYLPAYPELLNNITVDVMLHIKHFEVTHLLVDSGTIPLGVACSLQSTLSLVYSRGGHQSTVYDLVGAYNSGDKAILLTNCIDDLTKMTHVIAEANSVGLDIQHVITFFEVRQVDALAAIPVTTILRLVDVASDLANAGFLSEGQRQTVMSWINDC